MTDQATERTVIGAPLEACWAVVTDFAHYADWANDIKSVTILDRDNEGRETRVTFRAGAFGRSTSYTLVYDYSDAPHRLAWVQAAGDITSRLDGDYQFTPSAGGGTDVTYNLMVELKVPLPGFVKQRAAARIIATALRELKARIERGVGEDTASAEPI
ncbi:MAG: SRPBCC family protein [Actinobacteria bacterium]|nr:SRPBCC family protein [Actinomycetota bacterium]